jgi:Peptidase inhibitor family I36
MTRHARRGAVALAAAAALAVGAGPADASAEQSTKIQRQVDQVLRHAAPGARQVAPNRVTWPRAGASVTISESGKARAARFSDCQLGYVCLWQDANGTNRRVQFWHYRTYRLANYGMPAGTHRGASSYYNHQTDGAGAFLRGKDFTWHMWGFDNLSYLNDKARTITLTP